jgi:6-phosphogluconolactonase
MNLEVFENPDAVAQRAASLIADQARSAVRMRGRFVIAFSGGKTPWEMLRKLSREEVPWDRVHIVQVDERVAPEEDIDRNLVHLRENLLDGINIKTEQVHAIRVDQPDLQLTACEYEATLREIAGDPAVLDLVHLGLGPDGHTASLIPEDPVLKVKDADVAITGVYEGRQRITLTYPILNRSRFILWFVIGEDKREMLLRLYSGDTAIPAGRVSRQQALILTDQPVD